MQGKIILFLAICYLCSGVFAPAAAESRFFKSPFSIFSNKSETSDENNEDDLKATIEKKEKNLKPVMQVDPKNFLNVVYAENTVDKIEFYIEEGDMQSAEETLIPVKDWVYRATEYHTDLFRSLRKVNNSEVQADIERELAVKFAVLRDRVLFQEAKILLANGEQKKAVENLVEIVRSQPSTDLGFKAYETLQEIGFTYKLEYQVVDEEESPEKEAE